MSKYKYTLRDYHAIKEAEIKLDGITVLSGINGCGKSTLSRWLYYLVNGINGFDNNAFSEFITSLKGLLSKFKFVLREIEMVEHVHAKSFLGKVIRVNEELDLLTEQSGDIEKKVNKSIQLLYLLLSEIKQILKDYYFSEKVSIERKKRISSFLDIKDLKDDDIEKSLNSFVDSYKDIIGSRRLNLFLKMRTRSIDTLYEFLSNLYETSLEKPSDIQLEEDGDELLIRNTFSSIFNLRKAIYIDTPMSLTANDLSNHFWTDLRDKLKERKVSVTNNKKLLLRISKILNGSVVVKTEKLLGVYEENTLRFVSSDKQIDIPLRDVATGYKSFSYIQRLLENGELTSETLLMIDEPEAHLHPQWIVEFARILVMLHKEIGVKIMIASHNPDMISAIQAIAEATGVIENTNFYLAEPYEGNPHQYVYRCLGQDIEDIFKSFNVAFDKINTYAGRSIGL